MSEKIKSSIETFHEHGIYVPRRTVNIFGEVDEEGVLAEQVISNLHALDHVQGTINVIINSPGGDVTHGRAIYDALSGCKNHVRGMVYGEASSMASLILQACDQRCMAPGAMLMIHIGECEAGGHPEIKKAWDAHWLHEDEWAEQVYLKKIKQKKKRFTLAQVKALLRFDKIIYAKEAVEMGLADKVEGQFE